MSSTIRLATRVAARSPSKAKGTPFNDGLTFFTKVISGWTEATAAPFFLTASSSELLKAPLECTAILPLQSRTLASISAQREICWSGTENQTTLVERIG